MSIEHPDHYITDLLHMTRRAHHELDRRGIPTAPEHPPWINPRRAHRAKLTADQRLAIAIRYRHGATLTELADTYNVHPSTISRAIQRATREL